MFKCHIKAVTPAVKRERNPISSKEYIGGEVIMSKEHVTRRQKDVSRLLREKKKIKPERYDKVKTVKKKTNE
jgi:hypothetical protein